jgi:hypothetical protein
MTFKQANAFVAKWRPILCPEWTVTVRGGLPSDTATEDAHASIVRHCDYLRATLYLGDVQGEGNTPEQRRFLLHELLHLTLDDLESSALEVTGGLGHDGQRLARLTIDRYVERTVDRLAVAFADLV